MLFNPTTVNKKRGKEKSRECHNHKPQPFPDTERRRKPTNPNKHKSNKRTKSTKISSLFPKRGDRNTKLCFPLLLHAGGSGLRLSDGLKTFKSVGWCLNLWLLSGLPESNGWFSVASAFRLYLAVESSSFLISLFVWFLWSRRCCTDKRNLSCGLNKYLMYNTQN